MTTVLRRLAGFTLLPLLSLVTPFLLMPVVARIAGGDGWSSVVAGQAVGTFGATVVFWGWNVVGPVQIARAADARAQAEVYAASLRTRLGLLVVVLPVSMAVSVAIARPDYRVISAAMAAATALLGLSPAWFGIGVGRPMLLLWYDTLPRFVAAVVATPVVLVTRQIWPYPVLLALSVVVGLLAFHRGVAGGSGWSPWPLRGTARELGAQGSTAAINLTATAYASSPVPIATATFAETRSSALASADTAYRLGLFAVTAMGNAFQGWTLELGAPRRARHLSAIGSHLVLGAVGAVAFALLGPWATGVLFGDAVAATREICVAYGVSFLFISASSPLIRNLLIPAGRTRLVLGWTAVSAVAGLTLMFAAARSGWLAGVAFGMAVSEAAMFFGLLTPALRVLRDQSVALHAPSAGEDAAS